MEKEIDFNSLIVDDIDTRDYPDCCDAYISGGFFNDGTPLDDKTIEWLNEDSDLIYQKVLERIY